MIINICNNRNNNNNNDDNMYSNNTNSIVVYSPHGRPAAPRTRAAA